MSSFIHEGAQKHSIKLKHTEIGTQKLKCPSCQPPHKASDNPLSLTIDTEGGFVFFCHHCEYKGNWIMENKTYQKPVKKPFVKPSIPKEPKQDDFLFSFFDKRSISKTVIKDFKLYLDNNWIAFPYFDKDSEVANIKFRTTKKDFRQSANAKKILYNYDNIYESDTVIFTEGEIDVLSLAECGFKNATTLPDGAPSSASYRKNDARFSALQNCPLSAKKIIIFTDNDDAGRSLHLELLHRFGKDICWYVKTPEGCKDANEVLVKHGRYKLKEIVDNAIPYPIEGLYTVKDYYKEVHDLYEGNYTKPLEIGLGELDNIYKILEGTFHTVTGIPNHGKSIFVDQVLLNLSINHGWKFAIFSPEHSTSMHLRRLVQMYKEKPFDEGFNTRMTKEELNEGLSFIHKHFFFIETKESVPNIELILKIAKSSILKHGINGIVIDPYNEVNAKRQGNQREDEHIRDFISECKRFARLYNIVVWCVAHPTKLPKTNDGSYLPPSAYDISGAAHWHNQADVVLTVHRDFEDNSTRVITRKIREQDLYGKIGEVKLIFDNKLRKFVEHKVESDWSNISFTKD
tara:strand:- start:581 stop:2296 length:1716 start_codon:yes stop_codon:yes gene_type:complete